MFLGLSRPVYSSIGEKPYLLLLSGVWSRRPRVGAD
jgi:hypothetical protein